MYTPKLIRISLFLLWCTLVGCASTHADDQPSSPKEDAEFYYKHWFKLTVQGADTFILQPCKENNLQILFGNTANVVTMTWVDTLKVHRYNIFDRKENGNKTDYYALNIDTKNNELFTITPSADGHFCSWTHSEQHVTLGLFVDQDYKDKFQIREQLPCIDTIAN